MTGRFSGLVFLAVGLLFSITAAAGQATAPARPGGPQRDTPAAQPKGTGVIKGRVVNDTGRPLRRAAGARRHRPRVRRRGRALVREQPGVKATRPDQQGQWRIKGLPPGDYLAIALEYVEDGAWNDPEYLESLRQGAAKFTLAEGEAQTVALKIVTPK